MRGRGALEAEDACGEASKDVTRRAMNLNDRNAELERRILELRNLESMEDCIEKAKRLGFRVVEELAGFCRSEQEARRTAWVPSSSITYSQNDFICTSCP